MLVQLVLRTGASPVLLSDMPLSTASPREAATEGLQSPIAGRIDAPPSDIQNVLASWLSRLGARRAKKKTLSSYRVTVESAIRDRGWTRPDDLTWDAITGYLSAQVESGRWKRVTYNRNLVVFRSLTKFMAKAGIIDRDPIDDEPNAADDSDEGARAATLEEARRHVAYARGAAISDGRSKCPRDLVWGLMYSAGLRSHEPEMLEWNRHVFLDGPTPHLLFTKDINKNGRLEEIPLTPELVAMLRMHRENMRAVAAAKPVNHRRNCKTGEMTQRVVSPDDPAGMVFPWAPSRPTFKSDRDKAGIEREDRRGRHYSPHSARKYFETQLIESGVHARAIDRLMRHKGGVEARYRDLSLASLAESLKKLPCLWPVGTCVVGNSVDNRDGLNPGLTIADHHGSNGVASPTHSRTTSTKPPRPSDADSDWHLEAVSGRLRGLLDLGQPGGSLASGQRVQSTSSNPTMPIVGLITVDRTWLAEVLETTARLLREGAADASPAPPRTIPKPRRRRSA